MAASYLSRRQERTRWNQQAKWGPKDWTQGWREDEEMKAGKTSGQRPGLSDQLDEEQERETAFLLLEAPRHIFPALSRSFPQSVLSAGKNPGLRAPPWQPKGLLPSYSALSFFMAFGTTKSRYFFPYLFSVSPYSIWAPFRQVLPTPFMARFHNMGQGLAHNKGSKNTCWVSEWMSD